MRLDKFTEKAQQALQAAAEEATSREQQAIEDRLARYEPRPRR